MTSRGSIEGQVQQQDIYAGLAENPRRSRPRVFSNQLPHLIFAQTACTSNTRSLQLRRRRTYLGIQPAA
jgi:hypothetical protein